MLNHRNSVGNIKPDTSMFVIKSMNPMETPGRQQPQISRIPMKNQAYLGAYYS